MTATKLTATIPNILSDMLNSFSSVEGFDDHCPAFDEAQAEVLRAIDAGSKELTMSREAWEILLDDFAAEMDKDWDSGESYAADRAARLAKGRARKAMNNLYEALR